MKRTLQDLIEGGVGINIPGWHFFKISINRGGAYLAGGEETSNMIFLDKIPADLGDQKGHKDMNFFSNKICICLLGPFFKIW